MPGAGEHGAAAVRYRSGKGLPPCRQLGPIGVRVADNSRAKDNSCQDNARGGVFSLGCARSFFEFASPKRYFLPVRPLSNPEILRPKSPLPPPLGGWSSGPETRMFFGSKSGSPPRYSQRP